MKLLSIPDPIVVRAVLASQPRLGGLRVGIMRTDADEAGPFAVLLVRSTEDACQVRLAPDEHVDLPGHGRLSLVSVVPATRERRGWVELKLQP